MAEINYLKLYATLIKGLSDKTKEVISRRFGIGQKERETLESIGQSMNITRERVRQIEKVGFNHIKAENKAELDKIFKNFSDYFKVRGGFRKEELILADLGRNNSQFYVLFLLSLNDKFNRVCEKRDFHSFWASLPNGEEATGKVLGSLVSDFKKINKPLDKKEFIAQFSAKYNLAPKVLTSYLEVSKNIRENPEGKIGLVEWPEINPRGTRDKAYLVFQKSQKPLHFTEVAQLISDLNYNLPNKKALPQTVHNELIKDRRFVLVGRGTYALKEWGYSPGTVKDVLTQIIKSNNVPMGKEQIVEKVLAQRFVAKNTVLMNLNDKKYFSKDENGKYFLRKTETA